MPQYNLEVLFTEEQAREIMASGNKVLLTKTSGDGKSQVAWIALPPFTSNQIKVDVEYALYVAPVDSGSHGVATVSFTAPYAEAKHVYRYAGNRFTKGPAKLEAGEYGLFNNQGITLTAGMLPVLNGTGLGSQLMTLNATTLETGKTAVFAPLFEFKIFLYPDFNPGTIIPKVPDKTSSFKLGNNQQSMTLKYDTEAGRFMKIPRPAN